MTTRLSTMFDDILSSSFSLSDDVEELDLGHCFTGESLQMDTGWLKLGIPRDLPHTSITHSVYKCPHIAREAHRTCHISRTLHKHLQMGCGRIHRRNTRSSCFICSFQFARALPHLVPPVDETICVMSVRHVY